MLISFSLQTRIIRDTVKRDYFKVFYCIRFYHCYTPKSSAFIMQTHKNSIWLCGNMWSKKFALVHFHCTFNILSSTAQFCDEYYFWD